MKKLIIATLAVAVAISVQAATKVLTLGSMASQNSSDFATAAQGAKADTAVQSVVVTTASNGGISVSVDGAEAVSTSLGTAATTAASAYATAAQGGKADTAVQPAALEDYTKTEDLGDLATMDTITLEKVTDAGDLAGMSTITLAKVTDAGTLAGKSTVTTNELASGIVTSLGKADSAVQSVTVQTASNGGISVSVDGGTAVSTSLGTAATTASTAYATAAQGTKADNALPAEKLTVGGTAMTPSSSAVELGSGYITVTGENDQVDIYKR